MGKISINQDSLKTRRDWKRHKIQDGSNVFRILPPFGDASVHNNYPFRKWSTVWLMDPKTGKRRPFASPLTDDGKAACPVSEYSAALKVAIEKRKNDLKKKGLSDEAIKTKMEGLNEIAWNIRVSHSYVYNASDKSGEVGLLELKSTAHKGMKKMMSQYIKEYGQDPTCLESDTNDNAGVWFLISKEGKGKETEYSVAFNQIKKKTSDGDIVKVDDRTPLSENIVENYADLGYDLNSVYTRKTYDELREILLYNLAVLAQDTPECVLAGYDVSEVEVNSTEETEEVDEVEEETPAPTKKNPKVNLNLDDVDDEVEDEDVPVVKKAPPLAAQAAKTRPSAPKDLLAMADDILGE